MCDQGGGESTLPNVVQMLFKPDENGMLGFSNVVLMAKGACDDVYYVTAVEGE